MGGKIYLALLILVHAALFIPDLAERARSPLHLLDLGITLVSIIGVFGYAFEKRLGHPHFWKAWLCIQVSLDIWSNFISPAYIFPPHYILLFMLMIFLLPEYLMLYRYGFRTENA